MVTGALLDTGPLAESEVAGAVGVVAEGEADADGLPVFVPVGDGEPLDVFVPVGDGLPVDDFEGFDVADFEGLPEVVCVPLGSPDG